MLDKLSLHERFVLLLTILFISLAMAFFLPAMFTFYLFYPVAIVIYLSYLTLKEVKNRTILTHFIFIVLGTVFTFGIPYVLSFMLFINIFPTYIVFLLSFIIINLLPLKSYSKTKRATLFVFISIIIGLNTNILVFAKTIINQDRHVNVIFNDTLEINDKEFLEINSSNIPSKYNKFDFISFGSNEGCMCGYWTFPKIDNYNLQKVLLDKEISFSKAKFSNKKIVIDYQEKGNQYTLNITVLSNKKIISSLTIKDYLPFRLRKNIGRKNLDSFDYRLEYLLRHNIWNAIVYYLTMGFENNTDEITNFINNSIQVTKKDSNWHTKTFDTDATLLLNSKTTLCSQQRNDNYNDYEFSKWIKNSSANDAVLTGQKPNKFIFYDNNITYTTIAHSNKFLWRNNKTAFKTTKYFFVLKTSSKPFSVILLKFTHQGSFIKELHIKLPKDTKIDGRNRHPISHIEVIDNEMVFRINNIYGHYNEINKCSYSKVKIGI